MAQHPAPCCFRSLFRRLSKTLLAAALLLAIAAPMRLLSPPGAASAAVEEGVGFRGVVDGFRGWYGSYRLGDLGAVWCVDHGIAAPDVALAYEPATLDDHAADTRRALAWAVGRFGPEADLVTAPALMLVLHDLMGAAYPSGRLDVDVLDVGRLSGFGGREAEVLARAQAIKTEAIGRSRLVGPLAIDVSVDQPVAGHQGTLAVTVRDANGLPIPDVAVRPQVSGAALLDGVNRVTGLDGRTHWSFEAGPGTNRFVLEAQVPDIELTSLRPTVGRAQRVARPSVLTLRAEQSFEAKVLHRFQILKRGDAEPGLAVTGARFAIDGVDGELVVGTDGRTEAVELLPGSYTVRETSPPPGYEIAGPWDVVINDADATLEVLDPARRGSLRIDKVDGVTGRSIEGASFAVTADRDADPATFEVDIPYPATPLLPGRYAVREVTAPPGYLLDSTPVIVDVVAGEEVVATVSDLPIPPPPPAPPLAPAEASTVAMPAPLLAPPPIAAAALPLAPPREADAAPAPSTTLPPAAPVTPAPPLPAPPPTAAFELPRTGAEVRTLTLAGILLVVGGHLLVGRPGRLSSGASSSSDRRGRRGRRRLQ